MLDWALRNNATLYCHWFQPLGSSGLRHGMTGQVQNSMFEFDKQGLPKWNFTAKNLLQGETDGSSFLHGKMRATHSAGAYAVLDPTSPIFLRGDTVFIPSCLISYNGDPLDEKTPLLRAADALSREGKRLLKHLGYEVNSVHANIGLEQELFFVPREAYNKRLDLQLAGRTVLGREAPRGQELCDHCKYCILMFYCAVFSLSTYCLFARAICNEFDRTSICNIFRFFFVSFFIRHGASLAELSRLVLYARRAEPGL